MSTGILQLRLGDYTFIINKKKPALQTGASSLKGISLAGSETTLLHCGKCRIQCFTEFDSVPHFLEVIKSTPRKFSKHLCIRIKLSTHNPCTSFMEEGAL